MKRLLIWIVVILVVGIGLRHFFFRKVSPISLQEKSQEIQRASLASSDEAVLHDPRAPEVRLNEALLRLAERQNPEALILVMQRAGSKKTEQRRSAATALGYFISDDAVEKLKTLTDDSDADVRRFAIKALSFRKDPKRAKILRDISLDTRRDSVEKIVAMGGLLRFGYDERMIYVTSIFDIVEKDSADITLTALALREVGGFAARDERSKKMIAHVLGKGTRDIDATLAALSMLNRSCLDNRAELIRTVIDREKDPRVLHMALMQASFLPKADAEKTFKELSASKKLGSAYQMQIVTLQKRLATAPTRDFCSPMKPHPTPPRGSPNKAPQN